MIHREEESAMRVKFLSIAVTLDDVLLMALREDRKKFVNRFEYIPLDMQKIKKKRKKAKKTTSTDIDPAELTAPKADKIKKKRPSQKKRNVLKKIKLGLLDDFNIKVKSKVWKDWVNK